MPLLPRLLLAAACLLASTLRAATSPLPRSTPEAEGVSSAALQALVTELGQKIDAVHGLVILRHGKVIAEGAWAPYSLQQPHVLFSLSKSFTSTAIGIAASEGLLGIDDPVVKFFPEDVPANASQHLKALRIRDLLKMSTGQLPADIDAYNYFAPESPAARFFAMPVAHKPGTFFYYNTAASYMLSAIIQKVSGQTTRDYLMPRLFEPLGIEDPLWEKSPQGISLGGFGLYLRTEEIARFGQLYLQRGEWQGRRLLPAAYVDEATTRQASNGSDPSSDWDQGYGYQFWRCTPGFYRADGAFGQFCIVMPQYDTVVAINSGTGDMGGLMKILWAKLLPELRPAALPEDAAAQAALKAKLASLSLPVVKGDPMNATATRVSGKRYEVPANAMRVEAIEVRFEPGQATITLHYPGGGVQPSCFSTGTWNNDTELRGLTGPIPMSGTGAWTSANTYTTRAAFRNQHTILTTTLTFEGDTLTVDQVPNVTFGKPEHFVLKGKEALSPSASPAAPGTR